MKTVVLGLDGFPFTLARRLGEEGTMPNLARLAREGCLAQMDSILPTVSNVAWTSYQTGKNPGGFGVFGFAELTREFELHIPNSADCKALSLQEILSRAGKKVISLGIPGSYPPRPVEGINVGGFLSPSLAKAVYPASALPKLEATGYRLDIDPMKARESLEYFKKENLEVFEGRVGTLFRLWDSEPWDYLAVHFMDTDRLMHFMFKYIDPEGDEGENRDYCRDFFRRIDAVIGRVADKLDADTRLIVLSDHGFCRIRKEVQLNRWLQDRGYLTFSRPPAHDLDFEAVAPGARAIALVPGKIYILEEGKWARGGVKPGEYGELREEIVRKLKGLAEIGRPICKKVYRREEALSGPYAGEGPDIVIDPHDGYDFKAGLKRKAMFETGPLSGMHTFHDAMLFIQGAQEFPRRPAIYDVTPTILSMMGVPVPDDFDGTSLV